MCGIFGNVGQLPRETAAACTDMLAHRGPDGFGLWEEEGVVLGHRRLSILDLSERGAQPLHYGNGRYHIVLNGEIYNFLELRRELEGKGHTFQSDTDTEVALAAFIEWGPSAVERFNGMWAMAIWDSLTKKLFLSRDRFGKKPLFYARHKGGFAFASEMKALFPLLDEVKPNLPLVKAMHRLYTYEVTDECIIEGIQRFPAGHSGWLDDSGLKINRWWFTLDHIPEVPNHYGKQVELFRELFFDACRLRMRSDVPIGTALSGGIDSSATISAMAHLVKSATREDRTFHTKLHGFVSSFPGSPFDETYYAKKVIEHLGIEGTYVVTDPLKVLNQLNRFYFLFEELYITSPIPFMVTYGAIKKGGVSVTLDGHAGDELFCGYTSDILSSFQDIPSWNLPQYWNTARAYIDSFPKDSPQFPKFDSRWGFMKERWKEVRQKRQAGGLENVTSRDSAHPLWNKMSILNKRLYVHTHETTLPTLLRNYDRLSMSNGVEIRMPFMDHRLVCFAFALGSSAKLRRGYSKAIIRDGMRPYMAREVVERKTKIGWSTPILDWMKGPLKPFVMDLVHSQAFKHSTLIDSATVAKEVEELIANPEAKYDDAQNTWTRLSPFLWENAVIDGWKPYYRESLARLRKEAPKTSSAPPHFNSLSLT